jgi:glycerophosphoryl diester phosphodiesterase
MLIFSHRGYHVTLPENTLDAFAAAEALGVDGIETDVRLSADGQPILFHDRLAPDGREVAALTRTQLCEQVGYEVPALNAALSRFDRIWWMLEIKTPHAWPATAERIRSYLGQRRLMVTSFWHDLVARAASELTLDYGLIVAHRPLDFGGAVLGLAPGQTAIRNVVWYFGTIDADILRQSEALGMRNFVWSREQRGPRALSRAAADRRDHRPPGADAGFQIRNRQGCFVIGTASIVTRPCSSALAWPDRRTFCVAASVTSNE